MKGDFGNRLLFTLLGLSLVLLLLSAFGVLPSPVVRPPVLDQAGNPEGEKATVTAQPDEPIPEETVAAVLLPLAQNDPADLETDGTELKKWPQASTLPDLSGIDLTVWHGRTYGPEALNGITVILDAGHGGHEQGVAVFGPEDSEPVYEKDVALEITLKIGERLTALGAEVLYTRTSDLDVSLFARAAFVADQALLRYQTQAEEQGYNPAPIEHLRPLVQDIMRINSNAEDSGGRGFFGAIGTEADLRLVYDVEGQFKDTLFLSLHLDFDAENVNHGVRSVYMSNDFISQANNGYAVGLLADDLAPNYRAYDTDARFLLASLLQAHIVTNQPTLAPNLSAVREEDMAVLRLTNVTSAVLELGWLSDAEDRAVLLTAEGQNQLATDVANAVYQFYCVPG